MRFWLKLMLVWGAGSLIYGIVQLGWGWYYADIARHEAVAVGTIRVHREGGRHDYFEYTFPVGERTLRNNDEHCETALTGGACWVGTPVLVYYDQTDLSRSMLNDYRKESSRSFEQGKWIAPLGLCLLLGFFLGSRLSLDEPEADPKKTEDQSGPEILHIVPDDKA